ncbi:MAG: TIR domain-containing protein [Clostridia bacterium]|nr:TIR domain-containing protein [Clostridia bacterium]
MNQFKFLVKKIGDSLSSDQPRVYFCATANDYKKYFEEISDDILFNKRDVAIYYLDNPDMRIDEADIEAKEEFVACLEEMQLFVVLLTYDFLLTDNRARLFDYEIAIAKNIPVFIIALDEGLSKSVPGFNDLIKRRQYVNKKSIDYDHISYDKHLSSLLASFLVNDELRSEVRDAFDSYIFLSYRKKDRKYIKEIMKNIHENEACRDVAIWYDEYISLGEDFSSSIKSAFDKSNLFVLAVTPSLLEENNYVMRIEYPMAIKNNVTVLPIEVVPTNRDMLEKYYEGIPECISGSSEIASWLETFAKTSLRTLNNSARHLYLIGLAYLHGIDVEIDYSRAIDLLTRAAEMNLPEAYEELISIYDNGLGVNVDYDISIKWHEKYLKYLKDLYLKCPSDDNRRVLLNKGNDLIDHYNYAGKYELCIRFCLELLEFAQEKSDTRYKGLIYLFLSRSYIGIGKFDEAQQCCENAIDVFDYMIEATTHNYDYIKLADCYLRLADVFVYDRRYDECQKSIHKAKEIIESISTEDSTNEEWISIQRLLGSCYRKLSDILFMVDSYEDAKKFGLMRIEIRKKIAMMTRKNQDFALLADAYHDYGSWLNRFGDSDDALAYFENAVGIANDLEDEEDPDSLIRLVSIYDSIGYYFEMAGALEEAKEFYLDTIEWMHKVLGKCDIVTNWIRLVHQYSRMGCLLRAEGNNEEAKEYLFKALDIYTKYKTNNENTYDLRLLSKIYMYLGDVFCKENCFVKAKQYYEKVYEISIYIYEIAHTSNNMRLVAASIRKFAWLFQLEGRWAEAEKKHIECLDIYLTLCNKLHLESDIRIVNRIYQDLLRICDAINDADKKAFYECELKKFTEGI